MTKTFSTFVVFSLIFSICFSAVTNNVLSDSDKKALLEMHNDARTKTAQGNMTCNNYGGVCPSGTITALEWDDTVAASAQDQANTLQSDCTFDHIGGHSYGENLAAGSTSYNYVDLCQSWIEDEAKKYCYGEDTTGNGGENVFNDIGHFTQAVSGRTTQLGCGCADNTECSWNKRLCVCHYNEPGNYIGNTVPGGIKFPYKSNSDSYSCGDSVPAPTIEATEKPDNDIGSTSCITITISNMKFSTFNGDWTCEEDLSLGYVYSKGDFYLYFLNAGWKDYNEWAIGKSAGSTTRYGWCECKNCDVTDCNNFYDWNNNWSSSYSISISSGSAYSSSSSSNDSDNELMEGLLIGLGIAIGIFLIALLVYYCIKRKNSQKNQYNVVEMNNNENSISNHEYVTMQN